MKRWLTSGPAPIAGLVILLLASLTLMSNATQNSAHFGEIYSVLLVVNVIGLVILGLLIAWNLMQLLAQVRQRVPGARLRVRMVTVFVILAVSPVVVVYYFSLSFLHRGIDSWFDVRIEQALDDSLELSQTALQVRTRELLKQTELMASDIELGNYDNVAASIDNARRLGGAVELTLMTQNGHIIASSSADPMSVVPNQPGDAVLMQLRQSRNYVGLDPIGEAGLHLRVVVGLRDAAFTAEPRVLQALYPVTERMNRLAETVESSYMKYRELAYLRKPLKISFTLTLSLVLLLGVLTAVWAAFYSAQRMVAPIRDVVQGTQAVAQGDFGTQLPASGKDDLGFLVESFNQMTRRLSRARDETRKTQQKVEEQRTYLEAVLTRLSSGVLTLDRDQRLYTSNEAACQILGVNLESAVGHTPYHIGESHPHLRGLTDVMRSHLSEHVDDWRKEVILFGPSGRQVLMCRGTALPGTDEPVAGHVLVFDDVTNLIQAQRDAAWSEVARRLAHEIKNPLTPIQLSAERLRHKYLKTMQPAEGESLDRLTRTIVHQVEAMKEMVNAFSDYARTPAMKPRTMDVNTLVGDVLELYRGGESGKGITLDIDEDLPPIHADPDRLRQVLHNLTKNALEASDGDTPAELHVQTRAVDENTGGCAEVRFSDRGNGFPHDIIEHVFEPYVSTKPKGTGLGLAIVKKIVDESGGVVWVENNPNKGASVIMRFPTVAADLNDAEEALDSHKEAV